MGRLRTPLRKSWRPHSGYYRCNYTEPNHANYYNATRYHGTMGARDFGKYQGHNQTLLRESVGTIQRGIEIARRWWLAAAAGIATPQARRLVRTASAAPRFSAASRRADATSPCAAQALPR
jgi:hypothetical protein